MSSELVIFERDKLRLTTRNLVGMPVYVSESLKPGTAMVVRSDQIRPKEARKRKEQSKP